MRLGVSGKVKVSFGTVGSGTGFEERCLSSTYLQENLFIESKLKLLQRNTQELRLACGPDSDGSTVTSPSLDSETGTSFLSYVPSDQ